MLAGEGEDLEIGREILFFWVPNKYAPMATAAIMMSIKIGAKPFFIN
jgi:hypothetical protein